MSTDTNTSAAVPRIVDRALGRLTDQQMSAWAALTGTRGARFDGLARVAELYRREARWWGVLSRWTYSDYANGVPLVFGKAAICAGAEAHERAKHYDELAASARRRAALTGSAVAA